MANTVIMVNDHSNDSEDGQPLVLRAGPYQIHDDMTIANDYYNDGGMGIDSDI